jgi:hypothetical protein
VDGCGKRHLAKGYCRLHWERWKAHGDPLVRKWRNGTTKLTEAQVEAIRRLAGTAPQRVIAEVFGVTQTAISLILRGVTWRHA